jgi:gliding motility-associated-like protein
MTSPLDTMPRVSPLTTTRYYVVAKDEFSCTDTQSVLVKVNPEAVIGLPDTVTIYPGETYSINPEGNCLYFSWFPYNGLTNPLIANPVASPAVNTRYSVSGKTEAGCITSDTIVVMVSPDSYIDAPNAFVPGSGENGRFMPVRRGTVTLKSFKVYNRWGNELFNTTNIDEGWDGTKSGTPQPMGVYVYVVEAVTASGRVFYKQGNVTLLR